MEIGELYTQVDMLSRSLVCESDVGASYSLVDVGAPYRKWMLEHPIVKFMLEHPIVS